MAGAKRVLAIRPAATPAAPDSKRRRVSGRVDCGKSKLFIGIIQMLCALMTKRFKAQLPNMSSRLKSTSISFHRSYFAGDNIV